MPSTTTAAVDSAFIFIMVFCFLIFAAIIFFTIYFPVRYSRSRNPRATEMPGNALLEATWITLSLILALAMFFYGLTGFKFLHAAPSDSMNVEVTARQWSWLFTYANGKQSTDLVVPQGADVALTMQSMDVIHGFFVPSYRIKQDVLPSMKTRAWFKATDLGTADILCTQYCGLEHSKMRSLVYVVPPADFQKWYAGQQVNIPGLTSQTAQPEGEVLLRQNGCIDCHSLDGSRLVGPTFKGLFGSTVQVITAGKQRNVVADEAYLSKSATDPGADVVVGFNNIMPSFKGRLSGDQLGEISAFLKTVK